MLQHFTVTPTTVLATNLSLPIVNHCVNSCVSCSTFSPVCKPYCVPKETIKKDLKDFSRILHAQTLSIIGGEPLLHPDLLDIVEIAASSGIADNVQIVTNGQLLASMSDDFWKRTATLVVTRYPGKFTDEQFSEMQRRAAANRKVFIPTNPMFDSFCKGITKDKSPAAATKAFNSCGAKGWAVILIDGKFYWCHEFYYRHLLGIEQWNGGLDVATATRDELIAYVNPSGPAPTCHGCTGYCARTQPWSECRDAAEWYRKSTDE